METTLTSTAGLIPMLLSLVGVLVTLQYLKGMADFSDAIRFIFWGFLFIFGAKLLVFIARFMPQGYYYFFSVFFHLCSAVFLTAGGMSIKGIKLFNKTVIVSACLLAAVWSWYVVIITRDASTMTLSLAASTVGYAFLAASLWRRKTLRNSIGFVITGWFCVFLVLYNLLSLMSWGQSLLSPAFETFLYIAIMCGWILISNNMMAHQFDTLEQEAEESKERLRLMIQMSPFPIIISRLKDDQLMLINNKAGALFGLDVKHPGNFKTVDYFAEPSKRTELLAKLEKHPVVDDFEFLVKPRKGEPFWLLLSARVIDFEYEIALYMAFQDITDRKKKEMQLFDQATKDPLTKCYNRRQFEELAKNEVQRSRRYNHPFCLFMIDADHFKSVNDTHGHAVGDLVLQALADCCRRTLRESDIVARFGGEEFVILLPEATIENAFRVAERLRIKISKLVVKNEQNQDVQFTVSIGLVSSTVTDNVAEMLKMADEALYVAKENGRNQVVVFENDGPNKDLPRPEGEDIDKVKAEPLYYFKPTKGAEIKNQSNEPVETGVVGLSGAAAVEEEPSLEDEEEALQTTESQGVSLSSLYEDESDDAFIPAAKPSVSLPPAPPPPVSDQNETDLPLANEDFITDPAFGETALSSEYSEIEEELPIEEEPSVPEYSEIEAELPVEEEPLVPEYPEAEAELPVEEEPLVSEYSEIEAELPVEEEPLVSEYSEIEAELPVEEESSVPEYSEIEAELPVEEEPSVPEYPEIEAELPVEEESSVPEYSEIEAELPVEEEPSVPEYPEIEENTFTPSPIQPPSLQEENMIGNIPLVALKTPVMKMPVMKKIPIKMPPGMVKIPKMPGVVRVKIPKALHQNDAPVNPGPKPPL